MDCCTVNCGIVELYYDVSVSCHVSMKGATDTYGVAT
ncbi:hypothetical protein CCACVL1_09832 [Corchorus capsularis]|uniref:Uncharacterized protein n=1 Tax=Corchorus capsularis TaxID=210143 RepID=A0A1R3IU07_COCAP|nr:hypothetical protein CCACVL1_25898 [Corchorus capsularis]OMO86068.1 hypothetical protein CCACVL1_09832 [Corchorus capsularis]